jgi:hypothetical protein
MKAEASFLLEDISLDGVPMSELGAADFGVSEEEFAGLPDFSFTFELFDFDAELTFDLPE